MNEFLEQFLVEARELAEQAATDLVALEEAPEDKARLDSAFRGFHTLKGAAGIVEFLAPGRVLHAAEDGLAAVRAGEHVVTADLVGDCLACLDQLLRWLDEIEATEELPAAADEAARALVARFEKIGAAARAPATGSAEMPPGWIDRLLADHPGQRGEARLALRYVPDAACFFRGEDPLGLVARLPGLLALDVAPHMPWPLLNDMDPFACNLVITALTAGPMEATAALLHPVSDQIGLLPVPTSPANGTTLSDDARDVLAAQSRLAAEPAGDGFVGRLESAGLVAAGLLARAGRQTDAAALALAARNAQETGDATGFIALLGSILDPAPQPVPEATPPPPPETAARALRVDVDRIDALVKLTGELTVVKNALGYAARLAQDQSNPAQLAQSLKDQHALLDRLLGELQRSVLSIRVLPLRQVFQRFPRLVREMAQSLGKSVRLVTEGDATEADKIVVESLFEPLMHVIRNALDHGIEDDATRREAGKPPVATLRLSAIREGDRVIVATSDDGAGLDLAKIRAVAVQNGLATPDALAAMADRDVAKLIFAPGFSTTATVTDLSGRGVGMDAVRAAIARLGGQVEISTAAGTGTTIRFILPFTVMISQVMTVDAGGQVFGIPFDAVVESVRLPRSSISRVGAADIFVLRDRTVPLIDLAATLDLVPAPKSAEANIVVTTVAGQFGALEVERFGERLEVMLKPMEGLLAGTHGVAGTTLLGDGRVLIVLDLEALLG